MLAKFPNRSPRKRSATPRLRQSIRRFRYSIIASTKNCLLMSLFLAPMAFRKPISRVRSVTVVNIIFIMPIPPTTSEIPATAAKRVVKVPVTEEAVAIIEASVQNIKIGLGGVNNIMARQKQVVMSFCTCVEASELVA